MREAVISQPPIPSTPDTPIPLQEAIFARHYTLYREQRANLHAAETHNDRTATILLSEVLDTKEKLAEIARSLYDSTEGNVPEFCHHLGSALVRSVTRPIQSEISPQDAVWLSYGVPLSRNQEIPTPVEAIVTTAENLEVAEEFAAITKHTVIGMLLSGANAWGEFYAVRGGVRSGNEQMPDTTQRSDIDLMAVVEGVSSMRQTIENLVSAGMLESRELVRFAAFKKLYDEGKADIFSLRAHYKGIEESLHLMPFDIAQAISNLDPVRLKTQNDAPVNFIYDFRPNIPNRLLKFGGYEIPDTKGLHRHIFKPALQEVVLANGSHSYITEAPVGGPFEVEGQASYGIGIISFFLAVSPSILVDSPDKRLAKIITQLQGNIATIQGHAPPASITRSERMPKSTLRKVKADLSLSTDEQ